mmetsp:Transcript_11165/g.9512  ORF Transcript_11165/g.9512 Transcript_11165/m.9512 type:complete len:85 (+) Transcript_11165:429-683(+)
MLLGGVWTHENGCLRACSDGGAPPIKSPYLGAPIFVFLESQIDNPYGFSRNALGPTLTHVATSARCASPPRAQGDGIESSAKKL